MWISERYVFYRLFRSISQVWLLPRNFVTFRAFHKKLRKTRLRSRSSAASSSSDVTQILTWNLLFHVLPFKILYELARILPFSYITQFVVRWELFLNSNRFIFSTFWFCLVSISQILKYVPGRGLQFCNIILLGKQRRIEVERGRALLVCADDVYALGDNSVP
jgi:hypothetical protein